MALRADTELMALNRPRDYVASDQTAETMLPIEDVELILETKGKGFSGDRRKVMHFVRRVDTTLRVYRNQMQGLTRDLAEARAARERTGQASTLNPLDAAQYLTPVQKRSLFEGAQRDELARLDAAREDARRAQNASQAELNKIKFAVASVLESKEFNPGVRARFQELLRKLPVEASDHLGPAPVLPQWGPGGGSGASDPRTLSTSTSPGTRPGTPPGTRPDTAPDEDDLSSLFS